MQKLLQTALLVAVLAGGAVSQGQPQAPQAEPQFVPQDFTVDDVPISIRLPFSVFVNGKEWREGMGWHIHEGSTVWLGLPFRGMYILSLAPRAGENFQKAGTIRNNVIAFHDGDYQYEIRTSGPILGADKVWNLYMEHLPRMEMKGPLFGVDRLGSCTLR